MSVVTYDLFDPKSKANGHGKRVRHEANLATDLKKWLGDLDAAEALRREQLQQISTLRSGIYRLAKERGVSPAILRGFRKLMRKEGGRS